MYGVDESCSQSLPGCLGKLYVVADTKAKSSG